MLLFASFERFRALHYFSALTAVLALSACGTGLQINRSAAGPWRLLSGSGAYRISAGTRGVAQSAPGPYVRTGTTMCSNGVVGYLMGGRAIGTDLSANMIGDLWRFDGTFWTWLWGDASVLFGSPLPVFGTQGVSSPLNGPGITIQGHCGITSNGDLWFFGGFVRDTAGGFGRSAALWRHRSGEWAHIAGPTALNSPGVYGALGVPSSSNYPGSRQVAGLWVDSADRIWLFGGFGVDSVGTMSSLNDVWRYNTATSQWVWVSGSNLANANGVYGGTPHPGARNSFASHFDIPSQTLWVFGGSAFDAIGGGGYTNELWRFDGTNWSADFTLGNTATWVGNYSVSGSFSAAVYPGPRSDSALWVDGSGDVWIFGGYGSPLFLGDNTFGAMNDLWRYRPALDQWQWVSGTSAANLASNIDDNTGIPQSSTPEGLATPTYFWLGGQAYVFGGEASQTGSPATAQTNRWWRWNGSSWAWRGGDDRSTNRTFSSGLGVTSSSDSPGPRDRYAVSLDSEGYWLFGGIGFDRSGRPRTMADLWRFDTATRRWSWRAGDPRGSVSSVPGTLGTASLANYPGGRYGSALWRIAGTTYAFGGAGFGLTSPSERWQNDLWRYREGEGWTWLKGSEFVDQTGVYGVQGVASPSNTPGGRRYMAYWSDANGQLYIFGGDGYTGTGNSRTNELWRFDGSDWAWLKGSSTGNSLGVYGTQGVAASANTPGARLSAGSTFDLAGSRAIVYGGEGNGESSSGTLSDLWQFSGGQWTWLAGSKTPDQAPVRGRLGEASASFSPGARVAPAVWVDTEGSIYLAGGSFGTEYYSDLWRWRDGMWAWLSGSSTRVGLVSDRTVFPSGALPWGITSGTFSFLWSQAEDRKSVV